MMNLSKVYLATEQTVAEIRDLVTPPSLASVQTFIVDFINDQIYIISGGLNTADRTISTN